VPARLAQSLPVGFAGLRMAMPGVAVVSAPPCLDPVEAGRDVLRLIAGWEAALPAPEGSGASPLSGLPLIVLVDDAAFTAQNLDNFLWVVFTRSDPARDIHGLWAFTEAKHWGCRGPLLIDARSKPHHAPALIVDPAVVKRVDAMAAPGRALHGLI